MKLSNVLQLGVKELRTLWRDPAMMFLIVYLFTAAVYTQGTSLPETLNKAAIAIVDEDHSPLSARLTTAFYPPYFVTPDLITLSEADKGLDGGSYTFVLDIPPDFQRDLLAGRTPDALLSVDATRMGQAFTGAGYIQQIVNAEVAEFLQHYRSSDTLPVDLALRVRFNPSLSMTWFGSVVGIIDYVTMLSIILTGAALIREREHGTVEHLLVMPITPLEIMLSKIWSMGLVVLVACSASLGLIVQGVLHVPIAGSIPLFLAGAAVHLFATTSMGIFLGTVARSMPQFGLLIMLILLPLQMLSGGITPQESMPEAVRVLMKAAPTTHFVKLAQLILFRGAGIDVVWPQFLAIAAIGAVFFSVALMRFRSTITQMA